MRAKRAVLLIEDDLQVAYEVRDGLLESQSYLFDVSIVPDVATYSAYHYGKSHDVYIVDLQLDGRNRPGDLLHLGHLIVAIRAFERPDTQIVVYSAHAELEQVVWAMRNGATDFLSKAQTSIPALTQRIEERLTQDAVVARERTRIEALVNHGAFGWRETYAGRVIVVCGDNIVAHGVSRMEALVAYRNVCLEHPDMPLIPVVLELGPSARTPSQYRPEMMRTTPIVK